MLWKNKLSLSLPRLCGQPLCMSLKQTQFWLSNLSCGRPQLHGKLVNHKQALADYEIHKTMRRRSESAFL